LSDDAGVLFLAGVAAVLPEEVIFADTVHADRDDGLAGLLVKAVAGNVISRT
jgi:hypothetical protein